jgi:hypothetical protein
LVDDRLAASPTQMVLAPAAIVLSLPEPRLVNGIGSAAMASA